MRGMVAGLALIVAGMGMGRGEVDGVDEVVEGGE